MRFMYFDSILFGTLWRVITGLPVESFIVTSSVIEDEFFLLTTYYLESRSETRFTGRIPRHFCCGSNRLICVTFLLTFFFGWPSSWLSSSWACFVSPKKFSFAGPDSSSNTSLLRKKFIPLRFFLLIVGESLSSKNYWFEMILVFGLGFPSESLLERLPDGSY